MSLSGIKMVSFEATNTLLKFRIPPWSYYTLIAKDYGYKGSEKDLKEKFIDSYNFMWSRFPNFGKRIIPWDKWWQKVITKTFEDQFPKEKNIDISKILIEEYKSPKLWCVAEGGRKLLNVLQEKGIVLGVISNFDPRLHDILRNVGILKQFKFIITSYEAGCRKPDKQIFSQALKLSGCSKQSQCLHIGDDVHNDYEGALTAGWHALIVTNPENPRFKNSDVQPPADHMFPSLQAIALAIEENSLKL